MTLKLIPVIMAGGTGSRLWPLSRVQYPKQFLSLDGTGQTMLQATLRRIEGLEVAHPLVICNEEHRFLAAEQMRTSGCESSKILLEPVGRNTAPAIALAAFHVLKNSADGSDPVLLVMAADHFIRDKSAFHKSIQAAVPLAQSGKLVTCGVVPTHAETGYGYIELGAPVGEGYEVRRFVEKPDEATAQAYVSSGRFLWNSGMFVFHANRFLTELEMWAPDIFSACQAAMETTSEDMTFVRLDRSAFELCRSESVDYAVMERTEAAVVVPLDAGWSDVGSWSSLWSETPKVDQRNVLVGDAHAFDSTGMYMRSGGRLVVSLGVQDLVVVDTKDAVLVADRHRVQDVKNVVDWLKLNGRTEHVVHREVYRPWGYYDCVDSGDRYQVKRITVNPGARLSVQMHHHRAEHWIVVSGTAHVICGDKKMLLTENQSIYIPVGEVHSLENPGKIPLELIEVQSGSYLGEDDIVRFEDIYGRDSFN